MRLLEFKRTKLFDGIEDGLFDTDFQLNIEGKSVLFIVDDITPHKLIDCPVKEDVINKLLLESDGISNIVTKEQRLQVYYLNEDDLLIIFSMGEYQPGRYMLFLEGVFLKLNLFPT